MTDAINDLLGLLSNEPARCNDHSDYGDPPYDYLGTMGEQARGTYQPKHRAEPPAVIEQALQRIEERGGVVVSIENEADLWDIRLSLLAGDIPALTLDDVRLLLRATEVRR